MAISSEDPSQRLSVDSGIQTLELSLLVKGSLVCWLSLSRMLILNRLVEAVALGLRT